VERCRRDLGLRRCDRVAVERYFRSLALTDLAKSLLKLKQNPVCKMYMQNVFNKQFYALSRSNTM